MPTDSEKVLSERIRARMRPVSFTDDPHGPTLADEVATLEQRVAAIMEGQELLKAQTVRIRAVLGGSTRDTPDGLPGDTEELARRTMQRIADLEAKLARASGSEGAVAWVSETGLAALRNGGEAHAYAASNWNGVGSPVMLYTHPAPANEGSEVAVGKPCTDHRRTGYSVACAFCEHPAPAQQPTTGEAEDWYPGLSDQLIYMGVPRDLANKMARGINGDQGRSVVRAVCEPTTPYARALQQTVDAGIGGMVPSGWRLVEVETIKELAEENWCAKMYHRDTLALVFGTGPTPEAAVRDAANKVAK